MAKADGELKTVCIQNASLDERDGKIVAHGWLDLDAIESLNVGSYQREVLHTNKNKKSRVLRAVEENVQLPDILLGMRGQRYTARGKTMILEDPVFIIDGLQRTSAMRQHAADNPDARRRLRIGAEIRFDTTQESEKVLFTSVNLHRSAMSPNVILRNMRDEHRGLATLYGLSRSDKDFPLFGKVCWNQRMTREELITATVLAKASAALHRHISAGKDGRADLLGGKLDRQAAAIGLQTFRKNIVSFFETLDAIWGIRGIKYVDATYHLRGNFMNSLANVLSDHSDFWEDDALVLDRAFINKMKSFPLDDPSIQRLAAGGSTTGLILYRHLVDHLNKNKQQSRYIRRRPTIDANGKKTKTGRTRRNDAAVVSEASPS